MLIFFVIHLRWIFLIIISVLCTFSTIAKSIKTISINLIVQVQFIKLLFRLNFAVQLFIVFIRDQGLLWEHFKISEALFGTGDFVQL